MAQAKNREALSSEQSMQLARARIVNKMTMLIILANLLGIMSNLQLLWPQVMDNYGLTVQLGASNLLYWISINGYFLHHKKYDSVPITMIATAKVIAQGMIGILPMVIGVAMFISVAISSMHQF